MGNFSLKLIATFQFCHYCASANSHGESQLGLRDATLWRHQPAVWPLSEEKTQRTPCVHISYSGLLNHSLVVYHVTCPKAAIPISQDPVFCPAGDLSSYG
jgi:hypothetical protein